MSTFRDQLKAFSAELRAKQGRVFFGCTGAIHDSVVEGSDLTGAPGQPVDTGNLAASWTQEFPEQFLWRTTTNVSYAPAIEAGGTFGHTRKAHSRGAHSRGAYTRSDGTQVARHDVQAHDVAAHAVSPSKFTYPSGGGPHSVKLTRVGFPKIVEAEVQKATSGGAS